MPPRVNLFWFRRDLRLHDNAGLYQALTAGLPVVPIFIFDSGILAGLEDKNDQRVSFIYTVLEQLQQKVTSLKTTLDVRYGNPAAIFSTLVREYDVHTVFTNHDYEPYAAERDAAIMNLLSTKNIIFKTFKDQVIFERDEIVKNDGGGYTVYTPFAKKWKALFKKEMTDAYKSEKHWHHFYKQSALPFPSLKSMRFLLNKAIPSIHDADEEIVRRYHQTRNTPSIAGTTRMGIHLRFGTVSVRHLVQKALALNPVYLNELIWREFFMQVLWHQSRVVTEAFKKQYDHIKWRNNEKEFEKWCNGKTGFPIVDAGMRELNQTGFMHNRVRMVVGSFLVKDLLIDWRWGEAYFARKLLDFELSSNNGNWQWVAGCGCDAAPYFRVFNPSLQAKKFDPKFDYIKKWIPEFGSSDYAKPMVDHDYAKQRCIKAYKTALQKVT